LNAHDRIFYLRKSLLKIGQGEFAKKINISRTTFSNIEKGTVTLTERVANDICREFSVNRDWLLNGDGPMSADSDTAISNVVGIYEQLSEANRKEAQNYLSGLLEQQKSASAGFADSKTLTADEVARLRQILARFDDEKEP
jgi:DNA-binding XRE family transcriptional regulator